MVLMAGFADAQITTKPSRSVNPGSDFRVLGNDNVQVKWNAGNSAGASIDAERPARVTRRMSTGSTMIVITPRYGLPDPRPVPMASVSRGSDPLRAICQDYECIVKNRQRR